MRGDQEARGVCADDPDMWFSDSFIDQVEAQSLCRQCPFAKECLTAALEFEDGTAASSRFGIWAGTTPAQRARMKRSSQRRELRIQRQKGMPPTMDRDPREVVARSIELAAAGESISSAARDLGYRSHTSLRNVLEKYAPDVMRDLAANGLVKRPLVTT